MVKLLSNICKFICILKYDSVVTVLLLQKHFNGIPFRLLATIFVSRNMAISDREILIDPSNGSLTFIQLSFGLNWWTILPTNIEVMNQSTFLSVSSSNFRTPSLPSPPSPTPPPPKKKKQPMIIGWQNVENSSKLSFEQKICRRHPGALRKLPLTAQ